MIFWGVCVCARSIVVKDFSDFRIWFVGSCFCSESYDFIKVKQKLVCAYLP